MRSRSATRRDMPIAPVMIYGDDVSHVVTEEGIAYLYKAQGQEERRAASRRSPAPPPSAGEPIARALRAARAWPGGVPGGSGRATDRCPAAHCSPPAASTTWWRGRAALSAAAPLPELVELIDDLLHRHDRRHGRTRGSKRRDAALIPARFADCAVRVSHRGSGADAEAGTRRPARVTGAHHDLDLGEAAALRPVAAASFRAMAGGRWRTAAVDSELREDTGRPSAGAPSSACSSRPAAAMPTAARSGCWGLLIAAPPERWSETNAAIATAAAALARLPDGLPNRRRATASGSAGIFARAGCSR